MLERGAITLQGSAQALKEDARVQEIYLGLVGVDGAVPSAVVAERQRLDLAARRARSMSSSMSLPRRRISPSVHTKSARTLRQLAHPLG